jgi:hypothetical protein
VARKEVGKSSVWMMKMKQKARFRPQRVKKTNRDSEPQMPEELSPPS